MYNHRGQPTGTNHRPTPRLANALSTRIARDIQSQMWETAPNLYRATQGPSPEEAQSALDNYRYQRDMQKKNPMNSDEVSKTAKYIGETIKMEKTGENFPAIQSYKNFPNHNPRTYGY